MIKNTEKNSKEKSLQILLAAGREECFANRIETQEKLSWAFAEIADFYKIPTKAILAGNRFALQWQEMKTITDRCRTLPLVMEGISEFANLPMRKVQLKGRWYEQNNEPLIAFFEENFEPVVLLPYGDLGYRCLQYQREGFVTVEESMASQFAQFAYQIYRPLPAKVLKINDILNYFWQSIHRKDLTTFFAAGILSGLLGLLLPVSAGMIFDKIVPHNDKQQLVAATVLLILSSLISFLLNNLQLISFLNTEMRINRAMQAAVWHRLLHLPAAFFKQFSAGDLAQRANAVNDLRAIFSSVFTNSFFSSIFSVFSLGLLFYYSSRLALVALVAVILYCAGIFTCSVYLVKYKRQSLKLKGKMNGWLVQLFSGMAKIRSMAAENRFFYLWAHNYSQQLTVNMFAGKIKAFSVSFSSGMQLITTAVIFYVVIAFQDSAKIDKADFIAFNTAFAGFFASMNAITGSLLSLLNIQPLYQRALPIMQTAVESSPDAGIVNLQGKVALDEVSFRYGEGTPLVLNNISLSIENGQLVAFVGPSGSGKSTIIRLLMGFEKPEQGLVLYDDYDLSSLSLQMVRKQCGVVMQNGKLLPLNILYNVIGVSNLTEKEAWEALSFVGLAEDVKRMPMGIHTIVGEQGSALSGGQRQRLLIARAIIKKPKIIIFDEATSALDSAAQAMVMENLAKINATRIVVAHRLSTVINADKIFFINKGTIAECGTYQQLLELNGLFAAMVKRQII